MKSKTIFLWGALVVFLFLEGCRVHENLEFRGVKGLKFTTKENGLHLRGQVVIYNPNTISLRLREVKLSILIDTKESAIINQKMNVKIKPKSEFFVQVDAQLNVGNILLNTLQNVFSNKPKKLQFIGTVKVRAYGLPVKFPVNHSEDVNF